MTIPCKVLASLKFKIPTFNGKSAWSKMLHNFRELLKLKDGRMKNKRFYDSLQEIFIEWTLNTMSKSHMFMKQRYAD